MTNFNTQITKTVGVGGDFLTLPDAWAWAADNRFVSPSGSLIINLLAGDHYIENQVFRHVDAGVITIQGQPRTGNVPKIGDMTSDRDADKAFSKLSYTTKINVSGLHSYGIQFPDGLALLKDVFIDSVARYTVCVGEFGPSTKTSAGKSLALDGVTIFGGVWGIMGLKAWITNKSQNAFLYQDIEESGGRAGGPFYLFDSDLRSLGDASYRIDMYCPKAQYGMWLENSYVYADNALHFAKAGVAIHAFASTVAASSSEFSRCRAVAFSQRGSNVNIYNSTIYACDSRSGDSPMEFWQGYSGSFGAMTAVGLGSSLNLQNATFNGCAGKYALYATSGDVAGFGISFIDCAFSNHLITLENARGYLRYSISNASAGSATDLYSTNGSISG